MFSVIADMTDGGFRGVWEVRCDMMAGVVDAGVRCVCVEMVREKVGYLEVKENELYLFIHHQFGEVEWLMANSSRSMARRSIIPPLLQKKKGYRYLKPHPSLPEISRGALDQPSKLCSAHGKHLYQSTDTCALSPSTES